MTQTVLTEFQTSLSGEELQKISGLPLEVFKELEEIGALDEFADNGSYRVKTVVVVKKAARLRASFKLDTNSLALIIHFIGESESLRDEINRIYRTNPFLRR